MGHYNVKPLQLLLKPSRQLLCTFVFASASGFIIVLSMPLIGWIKLAAGGAVLLSAAYFIARDALLLLPWSWQKIELDSKGELYFTNKDGAKRKARVETTSFVAAYMTLLNITFEDSRWARHVVVLTDTADSEEFRRLRVWLRWGMPVDYGEAIADEP